MKDKLKSYSFWMSVTAGVILILNNLGKALGFSVDNIVIKEIIDSVCALLVVLGILTMPKKSSTDEKSDDKIEQKNSSDTSSNDQKKDL